MQIERQVKGNSEQFTITLPVGKSGNPTLEYRWLEAMLAVFELFCKKQHDYSSNSIARNGEMGVLVRVDDKLNRLRTLLMSDESAANESLLDTWMDVAGYGLIGLLCHRGLWPKYEETEDWTNIRDAALKDHEEDHG